MLRDGLTGFLPEPWRWLANAVIAIVLILAVFGLLFAALTLAERKILGRVQNRPGPQPDGTLRPAAADRRRDQDADEGGHRPARRRPGAPLPRSGRLLAFSILARSP
jgi:hypothetical protein